MCYYIQQLEGEGVIYMKDYSLDYENSRTFVLNYSVNNNQITVNLASGENYVIPYTIENEKKLLIRMKTQVLQSNDFMDEQEKRFSKSWKWIIYSASMIAINVIVLASGSSIIPMVSKICAGWFVFDIGYRIYSMIDSKRNIKDVRKNKMLIENEEILNEKIKENPNVLANTTEKTKEIVSSIPVGQPVFTLNNIDKIKYEELKQILENIEREKNFNFDYSTVEDKPFVLDRKKN